MYTNNNTLNDSKDYPNENLTALKKNWDSTKYVVDNGKTVPANVSANDDLIDDGI